MFERLLSLFHPDRSVTPLPDADARHALGALMVRAAKVDRAYLFEEVEEIDHVLSHMYGLNAVEAAKMRARCEKLEEAMPDTDTLARVLHDAIPLGEREAAVKSLWMVVLSDGGERPEEGELLHQIERTLGVSPKRAMQIHAAAAMQAGQL
ncbi:Uncharacterized conserved protein, tellurite resistance protein B (TerB) family [Loktanella fryxellensis]|uniref:Uncharacterized conserved protein, tellurite resistance protein B (TerB) family n=1 Tax=Loktanella fryxellensis TaxID=245187 RepID=A0A1H8HVG5_9RHOB|nr:TerB family tellurite resistance protein [Loktanella fryxellensis]SEN60370.1 Uncharacterized conserved protein, tellurite resistance protein B (TerB) family [Loktanella fryxellensis]